MAMPLFSSRPSRQTGALNNIPTPRTGLGNAHIAPPPPAGSAASSLLKRYRPLETRAAGGFGSVEICLDGRLQRRVAIKRMPLASPYNRTSTETTATALAEARTASMLQHPNIVQVIDFTYDSAYAYLVMEYVDGMSLEEFLSQVDGHSLTYDEASCIADALVQALAFAHENGVLHLDIKPANVLIDRSGHVKLADFGMATLASAAGFGGARGGTIGYMAPEQLNGEIVDERSDVFSLAAVLYESLCATAPFRAGTPADSLKNIEKGVLYPSDLLPDIPETAEHALLRALSPNADDRMIDVGEFGDGFLPGLGNPREGRRSLARIIARLTSDEGEPNDGETEAQGRVWELDPAEGYLGSRTGRARAYALGAVSGLAVTAVSWSLLGDLHVGSALARGVTAMGIGVGAALAPQIGSALAVGGLLMLVLNNTPLLSALPVAILSFAMFAAWWLVWGRLQPAASAT
ncbi:kinase domain protein, partial [Collinsella stercoris DSM 13279]